MEQGIGISVPRNAAQEYLSHAEGFLAQALGKQPELKEMSEFAEVSGATLIGSTYALLREENKEVAEAWLKKMLASMASSIRMHGSDAMVKVDVTIKDVPNKLHRAAPKELPKPAEPEPEPVCSCRLDSSGKCMKCGHELARLFRSFFENVRKMSDHGKKVSEVCRSCQVSEGDKALSQALPDILTLSESMPPERHEAFGQEMMVAIQQWVALLGIKATPLTEKAWKEATGT